MNITTINICPTKIVEAKDDVALQKAIEDEIAVLEKNSTWELVNGPRGKFVTSVK